VEPGAEASATPSSSGAQRALWGVGADGWELSRLAGGARSARLLIVMVDDASNTTWAQLGEQETIWAVADARRAWIERETQFGRICRKLDIQVIAASSPQAKGRVERVHGVQQDRLVKKLRRKETRSHEVADVYLEREYLPEHNGRFARVAAKSEDYHRGAPRAVERERIFRLESERTDWRGLGGALPQSVFPTGASESPVCAITGQRAGVRRAARQPSHRVPRACATRAGDPGTGQAEYQRGECAEGPAEVGARGESSVARSRPPRDTEARVEAGRSRDAAVKVKCACGSSFLGDPGAKFLRWKIGESHEGKKTPPQ
jgi:hypothetical protein